MANFIGGSWSALLSLLLIPFYLRFLGIEAYGLVAFFALLQAFTAVLDLGLSPTLNRELARLAAGEAIPGRARDLTRTIEVAYWAIGVVIGIALALAAPLISDGWLNAQRLEQGTVRQALVAMAVLAAVQWPVAVYQGGLLGLQRQTSVNVVNVVMGTVRGIGALLVLQLVSPTIVAFFAWQILVSLVNVGVMRTLLWRALPDPDASPRIRRHLLPQISHFAAGMTGIAGLGLVLTHLDKVILSRLVSLEAFAYYALAWAVARVLYLFITPVFTTVFPRLTTHVASNETSVLIREYHLGSQLISATVIPMALTLAAFSYDFLTVWTDPVTARNTAPIVSWLVLGTALNGVMNMPYALQLAYGWTRIGVYINVVLVVLLVPVIYLLTVRFGATGAAAGWLLVNGVYVLIGIPATHSRLLRGEAMRWLVRDVAVPLGVALSVVGVAVALRPASGSSAWSLMYATWVLLLAMLFAALGADMIRRRMTEVVSSAFRFVAPR